MIKSNEYVLKKLDKWYADKHRKNYTEEIAEKRMAKMMVMITADQSIEQDDKERLLQTVQTFSRERKIKDAETYFSQSYATVEAILAGKENHGYEVPLAQLLACTEQITQFIDSVRDVSKTKPLDDLINEDIDKAFYETFGGAKGFADFTMDYASNIIEALKYQMPAKAYDAAKRFMDITKDTLEADIMTIFGES